MKNKPENLNVEQDKKGYDIDFDHYGNRYHSPRLLADIGGTNVRFGLEYARGVVTNIKVYAGKDFLSLTDAICHYFKEINCSDVKHAVIAIANPVYEDQIKMTNHHWNFSISLLKRNLNFETLCVINDFAALAMAVPVLQDHQKKIIGKKVSISDNNNIISGNNKNILAVVGAGTGLGVASVIPIRHQWVPLSSEGGHATFSPTNDVEEYVLSYAKHNFPYHVSYERIASGPGIKLIYAALAERYGKSVEKELSNAVIVERAHQGDVLSLETLNVFCSVLGGFAGNVALTIGATGGVYIGGGVALKLGDLFLNSAFRDRFEAKGRFSDYLKRVPTYLIVAPMPAFIGASVMLSASLAGDSLINGF